MSISDPVLPFYLPSNCEKPPFPGLSLHRSPAAEDRRMTRPPHHAGRVLPGESDCSQGNRQMLSRVGGLLQQILLGTVLSWLPLPNGPLSFRGLQAEAKPCVATQMSGTRFGFPKHRSIILKYCWVTAVSPLALSCRLLKTHRGIIAVSKGRQAARPVGETLTHIPELTEQVTVDIQSQQDQTWFCTLWKTTSCYS